MMVMMMAMMTAMMVVMNTRMKSFILTIDDQDKENTKNGADDDGEDEM